MKILIVHNFYGSTAPSGENRVVEEELDLLREAGHDVTGHFTHSDEVRERGLYTLLRTGAGVPWNPFAANRLAEHVREWQPDVVHVHNVFPLLSPAIFAAISPESAVVLTLHNYRTLCPAAIPLRDDKPCTECIDKRSALPSLIHGCYRNSRLATAPLALSVSLHRCLKTYGRHVDALVTLSQFQRDLLVRGGLPDGQMFVKPNCFPSVPSIVPWDDRDPKAVFIGRLSSEKGAQVLIDAWNRWGAAAPSLEIIGDGPDRGALQSALSPEAASRVRFLGRRSSEETQRLLSQARLLIAPSICFEGFPLVLREAAALGVPVAASNLGVFPEVIGATGMGRLFPPGSAADTLSVAASMWRDQETLRRMSAAARRLFEMKYTPQANLTALEMIYSAAMESKAGRTQLEAA